MIGSFFQWSAPAAKPLLWIGVALLALFLLYHFVPAFARWVDNLPFRRKAGDDDGADDVGLAEAGAARALLSEADALAAEGRFAEAVHLLLYRSVEDIDGRRPGLVKPAMTSRDLAEARDLPGVARDAFSRIARAVEISLFGGRSIDAGAWQTMPQRLCRADGAEELGAGMSGASDQRRRLQPAPDRGRRGDRGDRVHRAVGVDRARPAAEQRQ